MFEVFLHCIKVWFFCCNVHNLLNVIRLPDISVVQFATFHRNTFDHLQRQSMNLLHLTKESKLWPFFTFSLATLREDAMHLFSKNMFRQNWSTGVVKEKWKQFCQSMNCKKNLPKWNEKIIMKLEGSLAFFLNNWHVAFPWICLRETNSCSPFCRAPSGNSVQLLQQTNFLLWTMKKSFAFLNYVALKMLMLILYMDEIFLIDVSGHISLHIHLQE